MKRKIGLIIIATLLVCLTGNMNVNAEEGNNDGCYIATTACPEGYWDYVEANAARYVRSMEDAGNYSVITVGQPFAFTQSNALVYHFPIICDGEITYVFRVFSDGEGYSGVISKMFAKELTELGEYTSVAEPMYISNKNDDIVATIGDKDYMIFENVGQGNAVSAVATASIEALQVVDITESTELTINTAQTRDIMEYINLGITETQGNNQWCTAYCLAACIRCQTSYTVNAAGCMSAALGTYTTSDVFPWSKVKTVAKLYDLSPTVLSSTTSNAILIREMTEGSPVLQGMNSSSYAHCVVLRGYSSGANTWSIWNPYYSYYENYTIGGAYMDATGTAFTATAHAYNFDAN